MSDRATWPLEMVGAVVLIVGVQRGVIPVEALLAVLALIVLWIVRGVPAAIFSAGVWRSVAGTVAFLRDYAWMVVVVFSTLGTVATVALAGKWLAERYVFQALPDAGMFPWLVAAVLGVAIAALALAAISLPTIVGVGLKRLAGRGRRLYP